MDLASITPPLTPDANRRLQDLVRRFEREQGTVNEPEVDLQPYLPPLEDALRATALAALIRADLRRCWRAGRRVLIDRYAVRFPELGPGRDLPPPLIAIEYQVRQECGDAPALSEYKRRFPLQFDRLRLLLSDNLPTMTSPGSGESVEDTPVSVAPRDADVLAVEGGFRLVRRLGAGGYGEVWQAEAPGGIDVAVKRIFRPMNHEAARRELQALEAIKGMRHPFLLATQMFYALEDRLLIVMELADASLRDRFDECRKNGMPAMPVSELMGYLEEAAEGLDFLHERRVIHRDVKPENILLLQRHAKLGDFGMARVLESNRGGGAGIASGTPAYMAPEVWRSEAVAASDQYALALSYSELRLGRRPLQGDTAFALMSAHAEETPDLDGLPEAERHVLLKALAKDPARRYRTCREFVRELGAALLAPPRRYDESTTAPQVLKTAALERTIPGPSADHLRFGERPVDADRALRFCGTLLGAFAGLCLWAVLDHLDSGVLCTTVMGPLEQRLIPVLMMMLGGVGGVLFAVSGRKPSVVLTLAFMVALASAFGASALSIRWQPAERLLVLRYPSAFADHDVTLLGLLVGMVGGLLGGALLGVGSRMFGSHLCRALCGAAVGVVCGSLFLASWSGAGMGLASNGGRMVWSENLLTIPVMEAGVAGLIGMGLLLLLPRVGHRPPPA